MPDDSRSTRQIPPIGDFDTEPVTVAGGTRVAPDPRQAATGDGAGVGAGVEDGEDSEDGDAGDAWPVRTPRPGIRMRFPTAVLVALLIAGGGIWGGAALQRAHGTTTTGGGASAFARFAAGSFGGGGARGARPFGGGAAASSAAAGIVTVVQGNVLYVTTASGGLVKVILSKSTTLTRVAKTTPSGLRPGDTVIVQGTKAKNGTVAATSVADSAAGVSTAG